MPEKLLRLLRTHVVQLIDFFNEILALLARFLRKPIGYAD
jgi:hypothetical protein